MAESLLTQITINNAAPGTRSIASFNPPNGLVAVRFALTRANLSDTIRLDWSLDLSQDSGASWLVSWGGAWTFGGVVLDKLGQPHPESSIWVPFPTPSDAATRVRGSVTFNERLTTTATIYGQT